MMGNAGAIMVDTIMRLKPDIDRAAVTIHLRDVGQFKGS